MTPVTWFVFDAFGTLLDVDSVATSDGAPSALPDGLIAIWRAKQLEYSWTLQAMGTYRDFWWLTGQALDYAIGATSTDALVRDQLRDAYLHLPPFPEVLAVLGTLKASGVRLAVLSNGTRAMLANAFDSAGLAPILDEVISVDEIRVYKPDPRVYRHAVERLGVEMSRIRFISANAWDVAGARRIGLDATWINRRGLPPEYGFPIGAGQREDLRLLVP